MSFIRAFNTQMDYRVISTINNKNYNYTIIEKDNIFITFNNNKQESTIVIPKVYLEKGVLFIKNNDVQRPVCKYYIKNQDRLITFTDCINEIFFGEVSSIIPNNIYSGKTSIIELIKFGFLEDKLNYTTYIIQKILNYLITQLPLHTTYMNSYTTNHRIQIIDNTFDTLVNSLEQHEYQVNKNFKYYSKGWTSLGLSDGSLASKNYMLEIDLRHLTPYGLKHHNPQRNLYSSLGMKGDEKPLLRTVSGQQLLEKGITRKGWNWTTLFVDIPDVWEDQIMVDIRHQNKYIKAIKRYFFDNGTTAIFKNDIIHENDLLFIKNNGKKIYLDLKCDEAIVKNIEETTIIEQGIEKEVIQITLEYKRFLKEGTKITNCSANKGVIRFANLGYAINPKNKEKIKIDVIVSAKAVLKRKNYGQILEALTNNINDNKITIIPDNSETDINKIQTILSKKDFSKEGIWECDTYVGKLKGICGKVFWGVTHDVNDTVWTKKEIIKTNGRGNREAGLKFSTIEFRALQTRFGKNNPLEKEILSYAHNKKDLTNFLFVLKHKLGESIYNKVVLNTTDIEVANSTNGILFTKKELTNTILDKNICKDDFLLKLPIIYQIVIGENDEILKEGFPSDIPEQINDIKIKKVINLDTLYIPYYNLRKPWKYDDTYYGISDISANLNTIILHSKKYIEYEDDAKTLSLLYKSIYNYFNKIEQRVGSKRGELSIIGMSVRYPNSCKAVATLKNELPKDTIEIHEDLAKVAGIKHKDIVLVERFPCLGFMSLRPQQVYVTKDILCKYTIRVSGNSLGSLSLDFDGDVLYLAAFKTKEARALLRKEWEFPNTICKNYIEQYNIKMGSPRTKELKLKDYDIKAFKTLSSETHKNIVDKLTGVKSFTGPVVALSYNILRILETSIDADNKKLWAGIEVFVDTVANSVFKQKHGGESLHKIVTEAICTANKELLVKHGFENKIATIVCNIIKQKAEKRKIKDLVYLYKQNQEKKQGTIINRIVREENKLYYASRTTLNAIQLIKTLKEISTIDIPSHIFTKIKYNNINLHFNK